MASPTRKISKLEAEERIEFALDLFTRTRHRSEQLKALGEKFKLQWRQCDRILKAARDRLLAQVKETKADRDATLSASVNFLESVISNPIAPMRERLQANKQLTALLGLNAPLVHKIIPSDRGRAEDLLAGERAALEKEAKEWQPPLLTVQQEEQSDENEGLDDAAAG